VAQRLAEGPLLVDRGVQLVLGQRSGTPDGAVPQPLQSLPGGAEAVRVGRSHRRSFGIADVELLLHIGTDLDAVDHQVLEGAVDLDVRQVDPSQLGAPHQGAPDLHPAQIDVTEDRVAQADAFERGTGEVAVAELLGCIVLFHATGE
jgi:hypothetical protein